jgi:glyoxylase-like metal-dependent hydrolase (beta-lactamase superfamily II)
VRKVLGEIVPLTDDLWLILGDMPADVANAILYRRGEALYLMDSGAGTTIRTSILRLLDDVDAVRSFTLLNSHGHADHVGNNDVIRRARAEKTQHRGTRHARAVLLALPPTTTRPFAPLPGDR